MRIDLATLEGGVETEWLVKLIREATKRQATDIHLVEKEKPRIRVMGKLTILESFRPVNREDIFSLVPPGKRDAISNFCGEIDFALQTDNHRFRVNVFFELAGVAAVMRHLPVNPPSIDDLGLPEVLKRFTSLARGLVLVTGPTGSGKSTTLAAMVNEINKTRMCRIITIEDPIEYIHENKKSFISHREVGQHTKSFAEALRGALREDPDVILVGEMRDTETIDLAIKAALTGHLVLSTVHTISAAKTVDRIIQSFPSEMQNQIRMDFADVIEGVISQTLLPRRDQKGLIVAYEVMTATPAVRSLIREGKTYQLQSVIETSQQDGMNTLDQCLASLVKKGMVTYEDALEKAQDKVRFSKMVKMDDVFLPPST